MNSKRVALIFSVLILSAGALYAQSLDVLQKRMKERLGQIVELKKDQVIGENTSGYLAVVNPPDGAEREKQVKKLVKAENDDRKAIYEIIADRTGATVEEVGRQRALQIYQNSAEGVLLQGKDGNWYVKGRR